MKHKLYYCPMEAPSKIRFISKESNIDEVVDPFEDDDSHPVSFRKLFKALKDGLYDEIFVTVGRNNDCSFYKSGERIEVVGEIALSEFSDGGGLPSDWKLLEDEARSHR